MVSENTVMMIGSWREQPMIGLSGMSGERGR